MRDTDVLLPLLQNPAHEPAWAGYKSMSPQMAAQMFVRCAFTGAVAEALIERRWLSTNGEKFGQTLENAFSGELSPAQFLKYRLIHADTDELLNIEKNSEKVLAAMTVSVRHQASEYFQIFARTAVRLMYDMSGQRYAMLRNSIYRAFDILDEIFGLDYSGDRQMKFDGRAAERIFAGAGLGVQSSYLSLFIGLRELPRKDVKIVDLGSGYGRVGLIAGLLFAGCEFTGFEYVDHRVSTAQLAAENLGFAGRVTFRQQDLSAADFQIPDAAVYYMYDPFTAETYEFVLRQLNQIACRKQIQVIVKGGALTKFQSLAKGDERWSEAQLFDEDTLGLFFSR